MKKGFVISWFFPPINSSEGLVTYKLLNKSKIRHDVFTQSSNTHWSYKKDSSLKAPDVTVIEGRSESFSAWVEDCVRYFDKHHTEYDFIMSRAMPPESHEAAMLIKNKYPNIKWIASFGDPTYMSPYDPVFSNNIAEYPVNTVSEYIKRFAKRPIKRILARHQTRGDRKRAKYLENIEKEAFKDADLIILNNAYQRDFMEHNNNSSNNNVIVLPHSYEPSLYPAKPSHLKESRYIDDKLNLVHTGHLDHKRTPMPLLKALVRLRDKRPDLYNNLNISFYGTFDDASKVFTLDNSLYDIININKPIDYKQSLNIVSEYDMAIVIDANFSRSLDANIYFPAKIVDYLGTKTPIFAISSPEGITNDIIGQLGYINTSHSVDDIYQNLVYILKGQVKIPTFNVSSAKKYQSASIATIYDAAVTKMLK